MNDNTKSHETTDWEGAKAQMKLTAKTREEAFKALENQIPEYVNKLNSGTEVSWSNFLIKIAEANLVPGMETKLITEMIERSSGTKTEFRVELATYKKELAKATLQTEIALNEGITEARLEVMPRMELLSLAALNDSLDSYKLSMSYESILSRYYYLNARDVYYDVVSGGTIKPNALNSTYRHFVNEGAAKWLAERNDSIKVNDVSYLPGHPGLVGELDGKMVINTWQRPAYLPLISDSADLGREIAPWLMHLEWLIPNKKERDHILDWFAWKIQHPETKINHALFIGGAMRIGKDTLLEPLRYALGNNNVSEPSADEVKNIYEDWAYRKELAIIQEIMEFSGWKDLENRFKNKLSSPPHLLRLRLFNTSAGEVCPNRIHLIFMSNYRNALHISRGDGRYFAVWCAPDAPQDADYYTRLYTFLNDENGCALVTRFLMERDLSHFNPSKPAPQTEFKTEMQYNSMDDLSRVIQEGIESYSGPFRNDIVKAEDVVQWILQNKLNAGKPVSARLVSNDLTERGFSNHQCKMPKQQNGKRPKISLWCIRNYSKSEDDRGIIWEHQEPKEWIREYLHRDMPVGGEMSTEGVELVERHEGSAKRKEREKSNQEAEMAQLEAMLKERGHLKVVE